MTRSSPPSAEPRRCRERHAAWLFKSRLRAACTRQIACQQAAKLSAWRLKRQRCLRGPGPRLLPSLFSFFGSDFASPHRLAARFCQRRGSTVTWGGWKKTNAASSRCVRSYVVPSTSFWCRDLPRRSFSSSGERAGGEVGVPLFYNST